METTISLDRIRHEPVAGYGLNYVGEGWLERVKGSPIRGRRLRATVVLDDGTARKAIDWITENSRGFPYSFTAANLIVGVELVEDEPARV